MVVASKPSKNVRKNLYYDKACIPVLEKYPNVTCFECPLPECLYVIWDSKLGKIDNTLELREG